LESVVEAFRGARFEGAEDVVTVIGEQGARGGEDEAPLVVVVWEDLGALDDRLGREGVCAAEGNSDCAVVAAAAAAGVEVEVEVEGVVVGAAEIRVDVRKMRVVPFDDGEALSETTPAAPTAPSRGDDNFDSASTVIAEFEVQVGVDETSLAILDSNADKSVRLTSSQTMR
jgi:hypothetical protein